MEPIMDTLAGTFAAAAADKKTGERSNIFAKLIVLLSALTGRSQRLTASKSLINLNEICGFVR